MRANHDKYILTPKQLYEWGTKNIKGSLSNLKFLCWQKIANVNRK